MKRISELVSIAAAAITLAACGSTDAGRPSTTASAPPAASTPMSGSSAAPASDRHTGSSAPVSDRRTGSGQTAADGNRATKALNLLVSSGYGSFTEFQPHGKDFTAVVARGGERTPMLIDPSSGRITPSGSGGGAMSGSSAPPAR